METGSRQKRFRKHQLWAIGITVFLHISLFGWLLFSNIVAHQKQEEYELLLEVLKEKKKEVMERQEESVKEQAEKAMEEILTHTPSKILEEGETEIEQTTEKLEQDYQEKVKEDAKAEVEAEKYKSPEIAKKKEVVDDGVSEEDKKKTIFYVGKSSVSYYLAERYRIKLPIPIYQCKGGGTVEVAIVVDRLGKVLEAEVIKRRSASASSCMKEAALQAALTSVFSKSKNAKEEQKGRIVYKFVPQN